MMFSTIGLVFAGSENKEKTSGQCMTIQSGELVNSEGETITTGFDEWGYNYQGRFFNGGYCDSYRDAEWCHDYRDIKLSMKWNDAWLSNKDCDDDGLLDRHYGHESYIGSGAWLTNHQSGEYEVKGEICKWNYFVKIVAAPTDAVLVDEIWQTADGTEIGPEIWGAFAIIQQIENDHCAGLNGMQYVSPAGAGLGQYKEKITFIHYADGRHEQIGGSKLIKKAKPVKDDACYSFISRDMEWWTSPNYLISVTEGEEGVTAEQFVAAVDKSIGEWNEPVDWADTDFINFGVQTLDSSYPTGINGDGTNVISFGDYDQDGVIAVCSVWGYFGGPPKKRQITEFDVMLDTDFAWGDGDPLKMDLQNILTHELGHAIGLGDLYNSECGEQTMFGYSWEGDIGKRTLNFGDIAGLNILY